MTKIKESCFEMVIDNTGWQHAYGFRGLRGMVEVPHSRTVTLLCSGATNDRQGKCRRASSPQLVEAAMERNPGEGSAYICMCSA
jgi:hypothetical protein